MGRELLRKWEITVQNELKVLEVSCQEFCSYIVILVLWVYSNIIKCYEEHSGFTKLWAVLFTGLVWSKLSSHLHSFLADTAVLLAPGTHTRNRPLRNRYIFPCPYFIVVSTQLKHFIWASQFTFQCFILQPHQFLLHTKIMCPKETKGYWVKSYKVRQCQNWSFPCNLKFVLVVLQPTLIKLSTCLVQHWIYLLKS